MRAKVWLSLGAVFAVLILLVGAAIAGFLVGRVSVSTGEEAFSTSVPLLPTPGRISTPSTSGATPTDLEQLFKPFWQAWQIVHDQYVDQPVDDEALMRGAIRGMLDALGDQHTSYMDPDQYRQANIPLEGEYEGIGAWVDPTKEYLTIISPMPGSPAEKAGLKPGDQVIAVDGEDMTGIDGSLVIRRILGPAGTKVRLTIRREGLEEPFEVEITRARIIVPSIESKMLDDRIAYIHILEFGQNTTRDLRKALRELQDQKPIGLIVDLRNNPGGALQTAIEVASEFIPEGVIMYEVYGDGRRDVYRALHGGLATDIPLVVLINEGTASASEIVAGAIQDYQRGQLVGTTSFGKGSVQNWIPLVNDQGAVRVTIARWLTPKERTIHEIGLEPDVKVEISEADIAANRDPQLEKAIELLKEGTTN